MMLLSTEEQLRFFRASQEERDKVATRLRPKMARTWPNFEKKHAEMGGMHHHHQN